MYGPHGAGTTTEEIQMATKTASAAAPSLVEQVKAFASEPANYEAGWDVIVETYSDEELAAEIGKARTLDGALKKLRPGIEVREDRRAEIVAESGEEAPAFAKKAPRRGKTGDVAADKAIRAAATEKAAAKVAPAKKAAPAEKPAPRWTKGQELVGGFLAVWPHGYYVLAKRQAQTGGRFEWIAEMSDGARLEGTSVADAEAKARAYGKEHGLIRKAG